MRFRRYRDELADTRICLDCKNCVPIQKKFPFIKKVPDSVKWCNSILEEVRAWTPALKCKGWEPKKT